MSDTDTATPEPSKPTPFKSKRQPMVLTCKDCSVTAALNVDPNNQAEWPHHRCRKTQRPAPFSKAKLDKENRHMPVWKL